MRRTRESLREAARLALVLPLVGFLAAGPAVAFANPELQEVVSGEVQMDPGAGQVDVTNGSIANWTHFDIQTGEEFTVNFTDGDGGNHLARVVNGLETRIMGDLLSNGHVYLANPAGILIGATGRVDMAGFHAAAGDIRIDADAQNGSNDFGARDSDSPIDGSTQYSNLTGAVRNLGEIHAGVVDLVGRYVENAGLIDADYTDAADPLNGYFVLAVGDDVIVSRLGDGKNISLRITGLAQELLDALDPDTESVGVLLASASNIQAGTEGAVSIGAQFGLGAGDLFGTAIHFEGGSETRAGTLEAVARRGDILLGEEAPEVIGPDYAPKAAKLAASGLRLCAGETCVGTFGVPVPEELVQRAAIRTPVAAEIEMIGLSEEAAAGSDETLGTRNDEAASLTFQSDGQIDFDLSAGSGLAVSAVEADGTASTHRFDIDLKSSTGVSLAGQIDAREFKASASSGRDALIQGESGLTGDILLADGAALGVDKAALSAETITLEGITVRGVGGAMFETPDLRPGADVPVLDELGMPVIEDGVAVTRHLEGVDEQLTILQEEDLVVDQAFADAVSDETGVLDPDDPAGKGRLLSISSLKKLEITASALAARKIVLEAGLSLFGGDLTLGKAAEDDKPLPDPAQLRADSVELRASVLDTTFIPADLASRVVVHDNFTLNARDGSSRLPDFTLIQEAAIDHTQMPSIGQLGGSVGGDYSRTFVSEAGFVTFGVPEADLIFGEGITSDEQLALTLDSAVGTVVAVGLTTRELTIGRGGGPGGPANAISGDLIATDNLSIFGTSRLDFLDLEQRFESGGRLTLGQIVKAEGSLALAARGPADEDEAPPITLEDGITLGNGNLDIENAFSLNGGITVDGDAADDRGALNISVVGLEAPTVSSLGGSGAQILAARTISIGERVVIEKNRGEITLRAGALGATLSDVDPTASIDMRGTLRAVPAANDENPEESSHRVNVLADGAITLGDGAELVADSLLVAAGRAGENDLRVEAARLHADQINLEAGRLGEPDGLETTHVVVSSGAEFRDATGEHAPTELAISQGGTINPEHLPTLSQFGLGSLQEGNEAMIYRVQAVKSEMIVDAALSAALLRDGTPEERGNLDLRLASRDRMEVTEDAELSAQSVELAAGAQGRGDLTVHADATIHANSLEFIAGNETPGGDALVSAAGFELLGMDGANGPERFAFRQDASIGGDTVLPTVAATLPTDGTEYIVDSRGGSVTFGDATVMDTEGVSTAVDGVNLSGLTSDVTLRLNAKTDIEVIESTSAGALVVSAGADVLIGQTAAGVTQADVVLGADAIELNAGVDVRSAEGQVRIAADSASFTGAAGAASRPTSFALRQAEAITDDNLPTLEQLGGNLDGMTYELVSGDSILVTTASLIEHSDLVLAVDSVTGAGALVRATLDTGAAELQLGSLKTCDANCEDNDGSRTQLFLHQSVRTEDGVDLSNSVVFAGAGPRALEAANGDIVIGDQVNYRGGDVSIVAESGDVTVGSQISTSGALPPFPELDADESAPDVAGGDVFVEGVNVTLDRVNTVASEGLGLKSGDITINSTGTHKVEGVTLTGSFSTLDAGAVEDGTAGDVTVTGRVIKLGSDDEEVGSRNVVTRIDGHNVSLDGEIVANRPPQEVGEGEDPELKPFFARQLLVNGSGEVGLTSDVTVDTLEVFNTPEAGLTDPTGVTLGGRLRIGSEPDISIVGGGLVVRSSGDVTAQGDIEARDATLDAGGALMLAGTDINAAGLDLRTGDDELILANTTNFGETTPIERLTIQQNGSFADGDIAALIDKVNNVENAALTFRSKGGGVVVDAATVNNTRLTLEAGGVNERIVVTGALDVHTLDLDGDADLESVIVRHSSGEANAPTAGFRVSGDLNVTGNSDLDLAGDLTSYTVVRFDGGANSQEAVVGGNFTAAAIDREDAPDSDAVLGITAEGSDGITLLGSLGARDFSDRTSSAIARTGTSLTFKSKVTALGDIVADENLDFQQDATFTSTYRPVDEITGLPTDAVAVGLDQNIEATNGVLTLRNSIDKGKGNLRFAGNTYRIDNGGAPLVVRTVDDLTLSGDGVLNGAGDDVTLESETGDVTLEGSLGFDGILRVQAGSDGVIRTTAGADEEDPGGIVLNSETLQLRSKVVGEGSLEANATTIELQDDVELGSSAALKLASEGQLEFTSEADHQRIEAASIELNAAGRTGSSSPTITRHGDLTLRASNGGFTMGSGETLTAVGALDISAAGAAVISDLNAMTVSVAGSSIGVAPRLGRTTTLVDETVVIDGGVDVVANHVRFSKTPDNPIAIGTPTASEFSDDLTGDNVLSRAIFPNLRAITEADLFQAADPDAGTDERFFDLVARGAPLVETSRLIEYTPPQEGAASRQLLGEVNTVAVESRPLWAQELLAHLEAVSTGGDGAGADIDDPRLKTQAVERAGRIYRGLFAPTSVYDEATGGKITRSHHGRIREVLQQAEDEFVDRRSEALTADNYLAWVATGTERREAMFYLSGIVDLAREASAAGVQGDDLRHLVFMLLEDVAPSRVGAEALAAALPLP